MVYQSKCSKPQKKSKKIRNNCIRQYLKDIFHSLRRFVVAPLLGVFEGKKEPGSEFSLHHFAILFFWAQLYVPARLLLSVPSSSFCSSLPAFSLLLALMLIFGSCSICAFLAFTLFSLFLALSPVFLFPLVLHPLSSARLHRRLQLLRLGWDSIFVQHRPSAL